MRICITVLCLILFSTGCGKPEVKSFKDLVADKSLIVLKIGSEEDLKDVLKPFSAYLDMAKLSFSQMASGREAVLAITNVEDFTFYAAIPVTPGSGDQVMESIPEWKRSDAEIRSDYLFIALSGDLPSSYGNYICEIGNDPLVISVDCDSLMRTGEKQVERFFRGRSFFNFLNLREEMRQSFKDMMLDSGLKLLKQTESITVTANRNEIVDINFNFKFKND